jgi:Flp pilus assembly protein TadG
MSGRPDHERGTAVIEFVVIGLLMMIPLLYLVIALGRVQAASFAADSSAREAARAFVTADDEAEGRRRAAIAVRLALQDQGFSTSEGVLTLECGNPQCLAPGGRVTAHVQVTVVLPGVPHGIAGVLATSVVVKATQVDVVDNFRPGPTAT